MSNNVIVWIFAKFIQELQFFIEVCSGPVRAVFEFLDSKESILVLSSGQRSRNMQESRRLRDTRDGGSSVCMNEVKATRECGSSNSNVGVGMVEVFDSGAQFRDFSH